MERVDLLADEANNDGKGPVPKNSQNVVDFEACLKESGLLDIQQGCGEVDNLRSLVNNDVSQVVNHAAGIEPVRSLSDEAYVHIPMNLREQIWRGDYINLALLLEESVELSQICSSNTLRVTAGGMLEARPRQFNEYIPSIERWTYAFLI